MTDLSTNACFDALSVLNNVHLVENVCSICGASHYTQNCPEYAKGDHVKDKPSLNLSRSSVPNGLLIMDTQQGSCVVTSQKFAKGTRFGPLLAQKSYVPIKNIPFPLVLFAGPYYQPHQQQDEYSSELQTLFGSGRNVYLDTRNETKCNWMIHVSLARFSNEQNLICYQENDEIYYTAVKDIELGDILRVWYSRNYATKIGASLLEPSPYDICNNILRSVSMDYGFDLERGFTMDEYNHPPATVGSCGSSSTGANSGGSNSTNSSSSNVSSSASSMMAPSVSCSTSNVMISSVFHDHNSLLHGMSGGAGGGEMLDIDSNNNSSTFGSAGAGVKGTASSTLTSYDKVSLPPIDSLMKTSSPKYASTSSQQHIFDIDLLGVPVSSAATVLSHHPTNVPDLVDEYFNSPSFVYSSHLGPHLHSHQPQDQPQDHGHFQSFHHNQQQQQHVGMMSSTQQDTAQELRLGRDLYSAEQQGHTVQSTSHHLHQHHHHHGHQQPNATNTTLPDYQCLPDDTLSPADLINISLGASDINIAFDSAFSDAGGVADLVGGGNGGGNHPLLAYEGTHDGVEESFGDGTGFDLMATTSSTGSGAGVAASGVVGLEKLHSRFSSSSDSLITLNDANLGMAAVTPTSSIVSSALGGPEVDVDKKYVCEVCLRKYMTKSNLDKHVRKHNLFLCVFCMKLFQQADELKEHECTERKSKTAYLHCPKCLKVLSNSWSLQRHMKIHKDLTPEEATPLQGGASGGGTVEEGGKVGKTGEGTSNSSTTTNTTTTTTTPKEPIPYEDLSNSTSIEELKPTIDITEGGIADTNAALMRSGGEGTTEHVEPKLSTTRQEQHLLTESEIKKEHAPVKVLTASSPSSPSVGHVGGASAGVSNHSSIPVTNTSSSQDMLTNVQAPNGKQLYKCIVCSKLFKNPNALEKHLRKVHTVYTISNDYKSEKKVLSQLNQKKTSPIKPAIAKALATKLSQKSKKQEEMAAAAAAAAATAAAQALALANTDQHHPDGPLSHLRASPIQPAKVSTVVGGPPEQGAIMPSQPRPYARKKSSTGISTAEGSFGNTVTHPLVGGNGKHTTLHLAPTGRTEAVVAHSSKENGGGGLQNVTSIANGGSTASMANTGPAAKSHSIIIISNVELTNNNLVDTSQLFLNQGTTHHGGVVGNNGVSALGSKIDVKVLNATDQLPKLVPISNHHHQRHHHAQHQHHHHVVPQTQGQSGVTTMQLSGATIVVPPATTLPGHSTTNGSTMHETNVYPPGSATFVCGKAENNETDTGTTSRDSIVNVSPPSMLTRNDMQMLNAVGSAADQATSVLEDVFMDEKGHSLEGATSVISHDELSNDNDCAAMIDEPNNAQLSQTFPCEECDRTFTKNYQLKRHMEIHDSVYYTCPYCDRLPLKAKASLRKHLYNAHPERAPPKEQINKFISTLVVTDENVLHELALKNMRKIRNKSAKMQAKQAQQQQELQQHVNQQDVAQHPPQQRHLLAANVDVNESAGEHFSAPSPEAPASGGGIILYENGLSDSILDEQGEEMLSFKTIFTTEEGSIGESSMDQLDHVALENCDQSSTCSSNTTNHGSVACSEDKKRKSGTDHREQYILQQQRRQSETLSPIAGGSYVKSTGNSINDGVIVGDGKRMKILNVSTEGGSGSGLQSLTICGNDASRESMLTGTRFPANRTAPATTTAASNGTGTALRYLRKNQYPHGSDIVSPTCTSSMETTAPSASSSMSLMSHNGNQQQQPQQQSHHHNHHQHGTGPNSALDGGGQLNLDSLFGNISIENYEFDDNATIQSFSLIEEKFKTSFDQIQEKLDAELPFDEEQIKWQNNLMANDSSSEIGDKLLTGEENIMLI